METRTKGTMALQEVPLTELDLGENIRTEADEEGIAALAESIRQHGLLAPVRVRQVDGKLVVIDGGRRVRACRLAGLATVPAIVTDEPLNAAGRCSEQLVANCLREDLTPLQTAHALAELRAALGGNAAQVATRIGFSASKVSRLLALLEWPEEIRDLVNSGQLALTAAAEVVRLPEAEREAALVRATAGEVTRDSLAGSRRNRTRNENRQTAAGRSGRVTAVLGEGKSVTVSAPDLDLEELIGLLEQLLQQARRARPQGLELATFLRVLKDTTRT